MNDAERLIRKHAEPVMWQILREVVESFDEIIELAVNRSGPGSVGEAEHGDKSFRKAPSALRQDRFEEYADALFYGSLEREITTE